MKNVRTQRNSAEELAGTPGNSTRGASQKSIPPAQTTSVPTQQVPVESRAFPGLMLVYLCPVNSSGSSPTRGPETSAPYNNRQIRPRCKPLIRTNCEQSISIQRRRGQRIQGRWRNARFFPRHFPFHHKDSVELKVCQVLEQGLRFVHLASLPLFVTMFISPDFNLQTQESASLPRCSKSTNSKIPECLVFRPTTGRSLSPEFKRSAAQLLPHQLDDFTGA